MPKPLTPLAQAVVMRLMPLGEVRARPMFGGYGLYADGLFFGLIAGGVLYFKVDDRNRPAFEARGIGPFRPDKDRPHIVMQYYPVPDDIFDGPELIGWAEAAMAV